MVMVVARGEAEFQFQIKGKLHSGIWAKKLWKNKARILLIRALVPLRSWGVRRAEAPRVLPGERDGHADHSNSS